MIEHRDAEPLSNIPSTTAPPQRLLFILTQGLAILLRASLIAVSGL